MLLDCFAFPCYTQSVSMDDKQLFFVDSVRLGGPFHRHCSPHTYLPPCDLPAPEEGLTHLSGIFSPNVVLQQSAFGASDSRVASGVHQASGRSPAGDLFFHSWLLQTGNCLSPSPHVISRGKATNDSAVVVPGGPLSF